MLQIESTPFIIEHNKMIAEFMGWRPSVIERDIKLYYFPNSETGEYANTCKLADLRGMKYHDSWDWLMPVVEKIETMPIPLTEKYKKGFLKNATEANIEIYTLYDSREEFKCWNFRVEFVMGKHICDNSERWATKLAATYQAAIKFLKWYKEYQKELKN